MLSAQVGALHLTERGAIPYNKSRGTPRLAVWARLKNYICYETVTGLGWRFHRFRLMRIVTVQPRICNVMVIGIYSPPFRECSPNRPPLMLVYAWSSGLRGRQYSTINALPCLLLPPGFGAFSVFFRASLPNVYQPKPGIPCAAGGSGLLPFRPSP